MTIEPEVKPLSHKNRQWVFLALVTFFVVAMPIFVFYAKGYRYDFFSETPAITATGGIYITAEANDNSIYIDEELVRNLRIFRQAAYIQSLVPGTHRIHVQGDDIQTWVKELPVYPHIVTEVESFNMPSKPQVRPITKFIDVTGAGYYLSTTTSPFLNTTTTTLVSRATSTKGLSLNPEYEFVESLFATTTATSSSFVNRFVGKVAETFQFSSDVATRTVSTTTVHNGDMELHEYQSELYAIWKGSNDNIPYYFCVPYLSMASTSAFYGEHVLNGLATVLEARTESELLRQTDEKEVLCREKIRIDNQNKEFNWFAFLPNSSNHVLLLLSDGLYVTEIDDRSWQNSQLLYGGADLHIALDGGQIFIRDNEYFAELYTEIQQR